MRVSCFQENLSKGLAIVSRAVSTRSTLPILSNILLEAKGNQLRLAATDRAIGINCWIQATVEEEGAITVPAKLLSEFVNSLPSDMIDMELTERTQTLNLRSVRFSANIKGIDAYDFPIVPTAGNGEDEEDMTGILSGAMMSLEIQNLRKMIDQVVFAASTDDSRPSLTGVEVTFKGERLSMVATDGHRLSLRSVQLSGPATEEEITVIVPARSLSELARISGDADETMPVQVIVTQERNQVLFQFAGKAEESKGSFHRVELVTELLDVRFPPYQAIIPSSKETMTVVDRASLLNAVRIAFLFARDNANIITMALLPAGEEMLTSQVRLSASSNEMGDSVNEIDATVEGDSLEITFNARYLIDLLNQIDEPQILLETTQSTRPAAIRPIGMGEDEFLHIIMPMHTPG